MDPNERQKQNYGQDEYIDSNYKKAQDDFGVRKKAKATPQKGSTGSAPKNYKRSDDLIEEDVYYALTNDRYLDASEIEVKVEDGVVYLAGTVDSRSDRFAAEIAIEGIAGVDDIQNNIKLRKWGDYSVRAYQKNFDHDFSRDY